MLSRNATGVSDLELNMAHSKNRAERTTSTRGLWTLLAIGAITCTATLMYIHISRYDREFTAEQQDINYIRTMYSASVNLESRGPPWLLQYYRLAGREHMTSRVVEVEIELSSRTRTQLTRKKEDVTQEMSQLFRYLEWLTVCTSLENDDVDLYEFRIESVPMGNHPLH
jgi:hypothetical protein